MLLNFSKEVFDLGSRTFSLAALFLFWHKFFKPGGILGGTLISAFKGAKRKRKALT